MIADFTRDEMIEHISGSTSELTPVMDIGEAFILFTIGTFMSALVIVFALSAGVSLVDLCISMHRMRKKIKKSYELNSKPSDIISDIIDITITENNPVVFSLTETLLYKDGYQYKIAAYYHREDMIYRPYLRPRHDIWFFKSSKKYEQSDWDDISMEYFFTYSTSEMLALLGEAPE